MADFDQVNAYVECYIADSDAMCVFFLIIKSIQNSAHHLRNKIIKKKKNLSH